jgi:hypothetical protein
MPCDSAYIMLYYPFDRSPKKFNLCWFFKKKKTNSYDSNASIYSNASTVAAHHD